jgi:hypothetical protein
VKTLDKSRPYGTVQGEGSGGRAFSQDSVYFRNDGTLFDETPKLTALAASEPTTTDQVIDQMQAELEQPKPKKRGPKPKVGKRK